MRSLSNIAWLGVKELRSLARDPVLLALIIWSFTFAVYTQAQNTAMELRRASIAIVDEDHSQLSQRIAQAFLLPYFKPAELISARDVDRAMDGSRYTFVIDIPPHFLRDVAAGRQPAIQVNVDATASMQAGIGATYIQQILTNEIRRYVSRTDAVPPDPVNLVVHLAFNPNASAGWFTSVTGIISSITILAIVLSGSAIVRERERGTMDHLLVMPVSPAEIALAKVWANGLVITLAVGLSLTIVVRGLLAVPLEGSVLLFMLGVILYLFFATAIGIFLGTVARSMPQLGLLFMMVAIPLNLLSGAQTPIESMPPALQTVMQMSPTTHFVSFAESILFRRAGLSLVWPDFLIVGAVGGLFFAWAVRRFRLSLS